MPSHQGGSSSSSAPARKEVPRGVSELAQLTRFLLDTSKVEDLQEMLHESCPSPSRKWLLALVLVSSTASSLQQMLAMLYPEPPEASEMLVRVAAHIESECLLEISERPSGGMCLVDEKTVQGIITRVLSEEIGGTCETYAADLVRMGIQLPLWTSREMARFSSSPSLQEKVVSWFLASLADQLLVLLQGCCMVEQVWITTSPTSARMNVPEIVAESLATAEVFRECLLQSAPLHESRKSVEILISELLECESKKEATAPPHCEERFGCILGGALDGQVRQVEHVCPFIRLHSLWRLVAVVLTWRYLVQTRCGCDKEFVAFLDKPGCVTSSLLGASAPEIGQAYFHAVINPMMEAEERARCEVAEEAANKAMAELLAEPEPTPGKRKGAKAKRGKKSDAGSASHAADGYAALTADDAAQDDGVVIPEAVVLSWQRLTAQLIMMDSDSPTEF